MGYNRSDIQRLALSAHPRPMSMVLPALKLGLLSWWGQHELGGQVKDCFLTCHTQVHEPKVVVEPLIVVTRLDNATSLADEDCGGMDNPAQLFTVGNRDGRLPFYLSLDTAVPDAKLVYILLDVVLSCKDPLMVALHISAYAPWHCGNLYFMLKTKGMRQSRREAKNQIYSWFSTTLALPGEPEMAVIVPTVTPDKPKDWPAELSPVVITPRFGSKPVTHWVSRSPITINYKPEAQPFWVPLVDYLLSWVNDFTPSHGSWNVGRCALVGN